MRKGGGGEGGGSMGCDARSSSLQRMVRRFRPLGVHGVAVCLGMPKLLRMMNTMAE